MPEALSTQAVRAKPLVVDLDGTLIRSDLLVESAFAELGRRPQSVFGTLGAFFRGKAALKHHLAQDLEFDAALLPYDDAVLELVRSARAEGRPVYLASASNERLVREVAEHLGLFDGWFGSDATTNLSSHAKARRLVEAFGEKAFDYAGNDAHDLAVWAVADTAYAIRVSPGVERRLKGRDGEVRRLEHSRPTLRTWIKLLRVHQYAKNALVFVPLLTSQSFDLPSIVAACIAVVAYSLCASGVYVLNDLVDLSADRAHRSKRNRPLANGSIPLLHAIAAIPVLLVAGLGAALAVSPAFLAVVVAYLALTTAYSFYLKRRMLIDVVALSMLYTLRVVGGAVAIAVTPSHWLLAFSMFIFTSLALIKRYIELAARSDAKLPDPSNRNYRLDDQDLVMAMAAAAGFNAVTIMALYIHSDDVIGLYPRPEVLWLLCPLLMYWIGRALIMARRRLMDDDPIVFALRDRNSRYTVVALLLVVAAAAL